MAEITKIIELPLSNQNNISQYHPEANINITNWIGQSVTSTDVSYKVYNKIYTNFKLSNNNLKLKNIKNLSFQLKYRKQPMTYDDNYWFIVLLLGYNDNNNEQLNLINNLKNFNFLLFRPSNQTDSARPRDKLYYYVPTNEQNDNTEHYKPTNISIGAEISESSGFVSLRRGGTIISNINGINTILFKPSKNINLRSPEPTSLDGGTYYNDYSDYETTTFNFNLTNNTTNYDNYYLFVTGPQIYILNRYTDEEYDFYEYALSPASNSVLELDFEHDINNNPILPLTITGEPLTTPIQIPASWSGDIIKAEDSIIKDFQRLDSILQALQSDEYGWKVISNYFTNPALITPTQYNSFITVEYIRPLQKIYNLCADYEAIEYNQENSTHKACYVVRHLGNPAQFSIIPKLDIYYNALKELYPDCFVIEENE